LTHQSTPRLLRARSDEAKLVRRSALLKAAARLFEEQSYEALTVDALAKASHLAKGTVYLYFASKEAIFLELLLGELVAWFDTLKEPLAALRLGDARGVSELLACTLGERRTLRRLLGLLHQTLERNIDPERARSFKYGLLAAMGPTAARLEERLPELRPGDGFRLLLHLHALVVGVGQMSDTSAVVKEVLEDPALAGFRIDFVVELRELLELVLRGWTAPSTGP
jgi:AcrR family transcriptional regulator